MRRSAKALVAIPLALLAVACRGDRDSALDASLRQDLESAGADRPELAPASRTGSQVVSAIESPTPKVERRPTLRHAPSPRRAPVPTATERPNTTETVAAAAAPEPVAPDPAPTTADTPEPGARPRPNDPVYASGPSATAGGGAPWPDENIPSGVIIRGGRAGRDRCDPRERRGGRGGGGLPGIIFGGIPRLGSNAFPRQLGATMLLPRRLGG